ncbi:unnamed protein product [Pleuronectes platessa]|uniref:Uncharacterized protein n=1 Tax=Pleuronectes platessa TaxID=8262 RepID=A0A9N7UK05_PLEPL|nr:unnamed protein product [Pleuronectes platessa]
MQQLMHCEPAKESWTSCQLCHNRDISHVNTGSNCWITHHRKQLESSVESGSSRHEEQHPGLCPGESTPIGAAQFWSDTSQSVILTPTDRGRAAWRRLDNAIDSLHRLF